MCVGLLSDKLISIMAMYDFFKIRPEMIFVVSSGQLNEMKYLRFIHFRYLSVYVKSSCNFM